MRGTHLLMLTLFAVGAMGCPSSDSGKSSGAKDDEGSTSKKKKKATKGDDDEGGGGGAIDPFAKDHLAIAKKVAKCDDDSDAIEPWCLAARGFAKAKRVKPPESGTSLGVTTFVQTKGASPATLEKFTHLSSISFRSDGDDAYALVAEVKGDTSSETAECKRVLEVLFDQFAGKKGAIEANAGLRGYLDGLSKKAKYKLEAHEGGYKLEGGSDADVRKVGKYWVSIETPRKDPAGIWLSVFTDKPY